MKTNGNVKYALALCLATSQILAQTNAGGFLPTSHTELDSVRQIIKANPTTALDLKYRLNLIDNWTRLLAFAGADLSAFEPYREPVRSLNGVSDAAAYPAVDRAFAGLEEIYARFKSTPEGRTFNPRTNYQRDTKDWALFHGNAQMTGHTTDPGPQKGKLAWKFPTGRPWYARPAVENGRVYAVSPGMTTFLYCLDESSGEVLWKSHQRGNGHQYGTARMNSSVLVLPDKLAVREVGSGGNKGHQKHIVYVNKKTGEQTGEIVADHIDYRVGYAPLAGNEKYLVYPHGEQTIHWAKSRTITTFDSVLCIEPNTTKTLWKHYVGEYWTEPTVDDDQIFVGTAKNGVFCLNAPADKRRVAWSFQTASGVNARIGVAGNAVVAASEDGIVYGIDRRNGKEKWRFQVEAPESRAFQQFSAPEIAGQRVYIGGTDRYLYCLNLSDGRLLWKKNLGDWVRAKPLVMGGAIYAATLDGKLYKFSSDGEMQWVRQPTGHQIFADLVAGDGRVLLNSSDLYLHCVDAASGRELWRHSLMDAVYSHNDRIWADFDGGGGDFQSPPTAAEDMVFTAGPDRFVHALDHESGKEIWRFEVRGQIPAAPVFANGRIYFGQQGGTSHYYCIDAYTGRLIWKKELGWGWASANVVDGKAYVPTVSGWVYCLDARTGATLWEYNTENGTYPAPAIEGDVVVFGSWNNYYYGFDKDSGDKRWTKSIEGNPDSGASLVKNGKAYLQGLRAQYFFCVDARTGKEIWKFPIPEGYECNMSPAVHEGRLYFSVFPRGEVCRAPMPGITYCLNADTGEKIWELTGGGGLTGPAVADGRVFFASTNDPYLWCVDETARADGRARVLWKYKMNGRAEESCVAIAYGKAYILATDGYLYAVE